MLTATTIRASRTASAAVRAALTERRCGVRVAGLRVLVQGSVQAEFAQAESVQIDAFAAETTMPVVGPVAGRPVAEDLATGSLNPRPGSFGFGPAVILVTGIPAKAQKAFDAHPGGEVDRGRRLC